MIWRGPHHFQRTGLRLGTRARCRLCHATRADHPLAQWLPARARGDRTPPIPAHLLPVWSRSPGP